MRNDHGRDIKIRFGLQLAALRKRARLSQDELARAARISRVYLGSLERGEKAASIETLQKLADGLAIPIADLFQTRVSATTPVDSLLRLVASLARGASRSKLKRFERIVRAFFGRDADGG